MKRIFILVLAVGMLAVFASVTAAQKSVVAIVKATPEEAAMLDGKFHVRELVDLSLKNVQEICRFFNHVN